MTSIKVNFWKKIERNLFTLAINQFKAEQNTSGLEHKLFFVSYIAIISGSTSSFFNFMDGLNMAEVYPHSVVITTSILTVCSYIFIIWASSKFKYLKTSDKPPTAILISTRILSAFQFIVYPFLVWGFATSMAHGYYDWIIWGVGFPSVVLGLILCSFIIQIGTNTYPSDFVGAKIETSSGLFIYCLTLGCIVLGVLGQTSARKKNREEMNAILAFIFLGVLIHKLFYRKYWNSDFDILEKFGYFFLFIINVLSILRPNRIKSEQEMLWIIIICTFYWKLLPNIDRIFGKVDVFDRKIRFSRRIVGFLNMTESIIKQNHNKENLSGLERENQIYYKGIMERFLSSMKYEKEEIEVILKSHSKTQIVIIEYLLQEISNPTALRFCLKIQVLCFLNNLPPMNILMAKLTSTLGNSLISRFEIFHLKSLLYARSYISFTSSIESSQSRPEIQLTLLNHYRNLTMPPSEENRKGFVDISRPLHYNAINQETIGRLKELLLITKETLLILLQNNNMRKGSTNELYVRNMMIMEKMREFENRIVTEIKTIKFPPEFLFLPLYIYYSTISHESAKANWAIQQIKKAKITWELLSNKQLAITYGEPDTNSAIIKVCALGKSKPGTIVEVSHGYENILGFPRSESVIGCNINDLFPPIMRKKHVDLMAQAKGFENILNTKKEFPLKKLDGLFVESRFVLKIFPDLDKEVSVIASLTPIKKLSGFLVLANKRFDILEAEQQFWNAIELADIEAELKTFTNFLPSLGPIYDLLILFAKLREELKKEPKLLGEESFFNSILSFTENVIRLNRIGKLVYKVSQNSPFYNGLRNIPITCRLDTYKFNVLEFVQAFVTFEVEGIRQSADRYFQTEFNLLNKIEEDKPSFSRQANDADSPEMMSDFKYEAGIREIGLNGDLDEDKIRAQGQDEAAIGTDIVIKDTKHMIDKVFENEAHYTDGELRETLVQIGKIVYRYENKNFGEIANKKLSTKRFGELARAISKASATGNESQIRNKSTMNPGLRVQKNSQSLNTLKGIFSLKESPMLEFRRQEKPKKTIKDLVVPLMEIQDQGRTPHADRNNLFKSFLPENLLRQREVSTPGLRNKFIVKQNPGFLNVPSISKRERDASPRDPRSSSRLRNFKDSASYVGGLMQAVFEVR